MPFLTRNENQSHVRYAAPASPMIATTGPPPTTARTPAPAAVAAASTPLRLATTLLRWTSEEAIHRRLHHGMPPVKHVAIGTRSLRQTRHGASQKRADRLQGADPTWPCICKI